MTRLDVLSVTALNCVS